MPMEQLLGQAERMIWSWPLLCLLLASGSWMLLRLRFYPLKALPRAMKLVFCGSKATGGGVSSFGALCTSLSATIGTGNVIGVATALARGGPGALFWMEVSALTGLSLKYAEGAFSIRYRKRGPDGLWQGGPFAYIELGLGSGAKALARAFAAFGAVAGLCGVGTFVQVGSISACLTTYWARASLPSLPLLALGSKTVSIPALFTGLGFALLAARVMFGGIRRLARFSGRLVPIMGGLYLFCCLWILIRYAHALPAALRAVLQGAFDGRSAPAGLLGAVTAGVSRGVFSHEAGLGTAPIASATAEGVSPDEQGLISMTAIVFDTLLVCTLTGLVLLVTGTDGTGISAAIEAFAVGLPLPVWGSGALLTICLGLFSFTTVVGWSFYGTACLEYLFGPNPKLRKIYLIVYILTVVAAPWCSARGVWSAANLCNALMALPNVIALLLLTEKRGDLQSGPAPLRRAACPNCRASRSRQTSV